jgi:hypothetical protein
VFQGKEYPVTVLDLPCVTETYKTYDDVNLVKAADVGQVLVVGDAVGLAAQEHEARDGITPPMRNPRARVFRKQLDADPGVVQGVEVQLLTILGVRECSRFYLCWGCHPSPALLPPPAKDPHTVNIFPPCLSCPTAGRRAPGRQVCGLRRGVEDQRGDRSGRVGACHRMMAAPPLLTHGIGGAGGKHLSNKRQKTGAKGARSTKEKML